MVKVKKGRVLKPCKFETKIPVMGAKELKMCKDAIRYLRLMDRGIKADHQEEDSHCILLRLKNEIENGFQASSKMK
ncbi:hypothetical protein VQ056_23165 [Paenibacillus sp. JTLBN-2024]